MLTNKGQSSEPKQKALPSGQIMGVSETRLFYSPSPKREALNGFQLRLHWGGGGAEVSIVLSEMIHTTIPPLESLRAKDSMTCLT